MTTYGLTAQQIDSAMSGAKNLPRILDLMDRPGENKPWYEYRKNFLTEGTIQRGVRFKNQYSDTLRRAEQIYGVPQSIILGILGVETGYGANKGSIVTRDALATLGFGYPRRAAYFQDELAALIAWSYQDGRTASSVKGSYAGAIGYPQFMPSNINRFGVDFDGNGHIDLINSPVDAIGSIANYLAKNGWQRGQPVGYRAYYSGNNLDAVIAKPFQLQVTKPYGYMQQQGFKVLNTNIKIDALDMVNGIQLEDTYGPIYYLIYPNFNVITTYNNSRMYATAVWQLGEEIINR
ncbi:lytic murein transglycosylase B [Acinetobacter qingfengensis]|nr:lytic murein transglycosylase B [Acinetobacter qingfengensis]